jgi:hypothetical protein
MNSRLSRDRQWVVCVRRECGQRLGRCDVVGAPQMQWNPGWWRVAFLLPGFRPRSDGRWAMSKRVWQRVSRGGAPQPNVDLIPWTYGGVNHRRSSVHAFAWIRTRLGSYVRRAAKSKCSTSRSYGSGTQDSLESSPSLSKRRTVCYRLNQSNSRSASTENSSRESRTLGRCSARVAD